MIWLQTPPWGRWLAATVIALLALWSEFRPPSAVEHPFALSDISPGTLVDRSNTETRLVPHGLLAPVELDAPATATILAGEPVLTSDLGQGGSELPAGWWQVEMPVPGGAHPGDPARIVVLDTGTVADGVVVTTASDDFLTTQAGTVAVEPEHAADVASAAAQGRVAVMIATP